MATRLELQTKLEEILGSKNVYFQPPETVKIKYPAIIYALSNIANSYANDDVYMQNNSYMITVIDTNPDSVIATKMSRFKTCKFDRCYKADNLSHFTFTLTY